MMPADAAQTTGGAATRPRELFLAHETQHGKRVIDAQLSLVEELACEEQGFEYSIREVAEPLAVHALEIEPSRVHGAKGRWGRARGWRDASHVASCRERSRAGRSDRGCKYM